MDSAATEDPPASVSAEEEAALLQDPASTDSQSEPPKDEAVTELQEVTENEQTPAPEPEETPAQLAPIEIQPTDEEPTPMETEETPLEVVPQEEPPAPPTGSDDVPQEQMEPLTIQPEPEDPDAMETENSAAAEDSGKDSPPVEAGTSTEAGESEDGSASKDAAENSGLQIASVTSGEEVPNISEQQETNTEAGATGAAGAEMPLLKEQDIKTEEPAELKNYATDTVNELLGMYGMDGLNEKEKEKVKVNEQLGQVPADQNQAQEPEEDKKDKQGEKKEKSSKSKTPQPCIVCKKVKKCKYNIVRNGDIKHLCDDQCFKAFRANPSFYLKNENKNVESSNGAAEPVETANVDPSPMQQKAVNIAPVQVTPVSNTPRMAAPPMQQQQIAPRTPAQSGLPQGTKVCGQCQVLSSRSNKRFIIWNGVNFCDEKCLACYQTRHTGTCEGCKKVLPSGTSAKFYLRQGSEMKQFCNSTCLDEYKNRLNIRTVPSTKTFSKKACFMCNKDITSDKDSFMAPVGKDSSFEEFCSRACMQRCEARGGKKDVQLKEGASVGQIAPCAICKMSKPIRHKVLVGQVSSPLCGDQCLAAFNMAHKINPTCDYCSNTIKGTTKHNMTYEGHTKLFCAASCMVSFKMKNIKMVSCAWCGTNKSNFDMIERVDANNKFQMFCSLNCLSLYRVNLQATSNQSIRCDQCTKNKPAQFHLTMSDASVRNFCSYSCVVDFQAQFSRPAKVTNAQSQNTNANRPTRQSSRTRNQQKVSANQTQNTVPVISNVMSLAGDDGRTKAKGTSPMKPSPHVIIQHPEPKQVRNKSLLCKPYTQTKATTCRPHMVTKETQTDEEYSGKNNMFIPVPVPVYIPVPMAMYSVPTPYPLPLPVPVPVPCFIPTTKKSAGSILSHIKEIQERIPADPFEAELLMMAEAVEKADKGSSESDSSESESELLKEPKAKSTENGTGGKSDLLEEDLLQAAFRLADEMTAPDLELTGPASVNQSLGDTDDSLSQDSLSRTGGTKRKLKRSTRSSKRLKKEPSPPPPVLKATTPPAPLSDANMNLKFTYGVNAWKHWVVQKNANLERAVAMGGVHKLFKTDILQCSADELNYSLCLFVKEVRKPSGEEYNPDSIYYLCLGIQQYLFESARVDNIFTDFYYEKFTDCLNEILQRFEVRLNPEGNIVCRIEEEHLWECQQLGAHSPYVLLNTLLFFNTKEYMLKTPQDHQKLSFTHILKQWRKGPSSKGGGRVAYLRFFPFGGQADKRKREDVQPYEQGENTGNPLRCPVKLYEFYLSKCPESIKNRNDLFYLVPERSCVPDSPVWYSTQPLPAESLSKMLNRLRLVREVQEAHLHCDPTQVVY